MVDGDSTSSNGEADERMSCVDDDSASDSDDLEENQLEDMELPDFNALNPNDFVLTQFATEKTSYAHRAGPKSH